jgi:anti-anti-sigma factor
MDIQVREAESVTIVEITGSLDSVTAGDLLIALGQQVTSGRIRIVADFRGVVYVSSAGLRALLATTRDTRQLGGDFRLAHVSPEVQRFLELCGFTSILKIFDEVSSAIASFQAS